MGASGSAFKMILSRTYFHLPYNEERRKKLMLMTWL